MIQRRLIWLLLWILSLVGISLYGGIVSYGFFSGMCLIPVISGIYLFYVYMRFRVYQKIDTRNIICGQSVPYCFILQNDDLTVYTSVGVRLFSGYSYVDNVPDIIEYRLFPGDKIQYDTRLTCRYRGEYDVGVKEIIITDPFGLFRATYRMQTVIRALVKPRIVELREIKGIPEMITFLQNQAVYENSEPDAEVRDYVQGDSLKRIHWKAVAASGKLKTRKETGTVKQKLKLLVDIQKISQDMSVYLPLENKILDIVIALLHYFVFHNTQMQLLWMDQNIQKRDVLELRHFEAVYDELASLYFKEESNFMELIEGAERGGLLAQSNILIFVTHGMDEILYKKAVQLERNGKIVIFYVITEEDIAEYIKQSSTRMQIKRIGLEEEPEGVL